MTPDIEALCARLEDFGHRTRYGRDECLMDDARIALREQAGEIERLKDAVDGERLSEWMALLNERDALRAENEGLRKDVERYRWVRQAGAFDSEIGLDILSEQPENYDAAVDAAMAAGQYAMTDSIDSPQAPLK